MLRPVHEAAVYLLRAGQGDQYEDEGAAGDAPSDQRAAARRRAPPLDGREQLARLATAPGCLPTLCFEPGGARPYMLLVARRVVAMPSRVAYTEPIAVVAVAPHAAPSLTIFA
ncbi:hypothetical protein MRX96_026606 [Rhipicephalus microplus]